MSSLESLLLQNLNTHSALVVGLAFLGGVASSFLPCAISMLPVLVGYVGGYASDSKWDVFVQAGLFIVGLALVMTVFGVSASLLGVTFGAFIGSGWYYAIGLLAIVMALKLLGVIHIPLPQFVTKLPESKSGRFVAPIILGAAFGTASSPCGTPFLAAILGFISREKNVLLGGASLFSYALGQGVLILVVGLFTGLLKHMAILRHVGSVINKLSAVLFIMVGLMLIAMGAGVWGKVLAFLHLI